MGREVKVIVGELTFDGSLNDSPTAEAVWRALPLEAACQRWGEEFYGAVPIETELEPEATDLPQAGDLGYWPPGRALCLFWGPTPASQGDEIRAASPVNIVGRIRGDLTPLSGLGRQAVIRIERAGS